MEKILILWKKKNMLNISIDDVSPHPKSSTKVLTQCFKLIEEFPDIKFSLFIPAAYWRTQKIGQVTEKPLYVYDYPEFYSELESLPTENFELCYHGVFHGISHKDNNNEFRDLNYLDAINKFKEMFDIFKRVKLQIKPIFRPPAWRMSAESIKASIDVGIEILALCKEPFALETYKDEQYNTKVVYCNIPSPQFGLKLYPKTCICYHACEWDSGYLNNTLRINLVKFIKEHKHNFKFIDELV